MNIFRAAGDFISEGTTVVKRRLRRDLLIVLAALSPALIFFIVAVLFASIANADETKTFTWTVPTQRVDDSPLDPAELTKYELGCASTPSDPAAVYSEWAIVDPQVVTRIETFPPGRWFCVLRIYATDIEGEQSSDWSNQVFFFHIAAPPESAGRSKRKLIAWLLAAIAILIGLGQT